MNLREPLLDAAKHALVPVDLEIGMQAALHQHAGAAKFDSLANLLVDCVEVENVTLFSGRPFQRTIERAESAIFGAKVGVINVAVDDVSHSAFRMHFAANGVRLHTDPDQVIGPKHLQRLLFGQGHHLHPKGKGYFNWLKAAEASLPSSTCVCTRTTHTVRPALRTRPG